MLPKDKDISNPYATPHGEDFSGHGEPEQGRCPFCGSDHHQVPSFTWWGGAIGQHVTNHTICQRCGKGFNKKTGRSNTVNIVIYQIVLGLFALGLGYYMYSIQ